MPPSPADGGGPAPPPSTPNPKQVFVGGDVPVIDARGNAKPAAMDPTRQLATMKARLESDPRPRYVVNRARMDHGPFNAVELLQQIASHKFAGADILRDELTGASYDWGQFNYLELDPFREPAHVFAVTFGRPVQFPPPVS